MNTPHTPGPWHVTIGDPSHGAVAYWVSPSSPEEAQAHKALIEQAPQLLAQRNELREALKQILRVMDSDYDYTIPAAMIAAARAALADCQSDANDA